MSTTGTLTFFPNRSPDETLYSQCARFHKRSGYDSPDLTGQLLFNDSQAGQHAQLPFGVDHFISLGLSPLSSLHVLRQQTISSTYLAFMPTGEIADFVKIRSAARASALDGKRGLFGHKHFLDHPLKYCPECVELDIQERGFSYWHTSHQFPGVWICARHGSLLVERVRLPSERHSWLTPPNSLQIRASGHHVLHRETEILLLKLAEAVRWLSEQQGVTPIRIRTILLQGREDADGLQLQNLITSAHAHFYGGLKDLEIDELKALGILPHRWFSAHEPPVLHPVQWAAAMAYLVPRELWDGRLENTSTETPSLLFEKIESVSSETFDSVAQLHRSILAMTLNISQTAPALNESIQRNLFSLAELPTAMKLHSSADKEIKRRVYRSLVLEKIFSPKPSSSVRKIEEAMTWILEHDNEWMASTTADKHKAMLQLSLFPPV